MNFDELKMGIKSESESTETSFEVSSERLKDIIFEMDKDSFKKIVIDIGVIPEDIKHDSSEEKLFSKVTDIVLARSFQELGLNATVNKERADCADVVAKSAIHKYSLVGDAKAFRLSRTAKNQKDFKVKSMDDWRGDHDFAVLACPYYQYPKRKSQIYGQALDYNVCLFSWEHLFFLLDNDIRETSSFSLSQLWNISERMSENITIKDKDKNSNFHIVENQLICESIDVDISSWEDLLSHCRYSIITRGELEPEFWEKKIQEINEYSREKAISELLSALKLKAKINAIGKYISSLRDEE